MAEHVDQHAGVTDPSETPVRHERPEDWGWHGAFGVWARVGGWISVGALCLMNVTTYYNTAQAPWIYGIAGLLVLILVRDRFRRKNAWRE
jgi:hypothetical protein